MLAHEAQQAINASNNAQQHNRDQNVVIIVKAPVIAIKYPIGDCQVIKLMILALLAHISQVRRFQIRFASDEDYYDAMKLLSRARIPTIEAGTFPQRRTTAEANVNHVETRPTTAPVLLHSSSGAPDLANRPATAISSLMPPPMDASHRQPLAPLSTNHNNRQQAIDNGNKTRTGPITEMTAAQVKDLANANALSAINLYNSRPSAAPVLNSQHFSQLLPPKRELPFEKTAHFAATPFAISRTLRSASKAAVEAQASPSKPVKAPAKTKRTSTSKTSAGSSQTASQKRKRNTSKVQEADAEPTWSAAKKKTKSAAPKLVEEEPPVPSIDEIWNSGEHENLDGECAGTIDTQALLARAEQVRTAGLEVSQRRTTSPIKHTLPAFPNAMVASMPVQGSAGDEIVAIDLDVAVPHRSGPVIPTSPAKINELATFPCTPAHQLMLNPSTPAAPLVQHTIDTAPDPACTAGADLFNKVQDAYLLLMQHPAFANSDEQIAAWMALPTEQRKQALQQFMAEQYMNRDGGFETIVKVLSECWETVVVWAEVYRRSY